MYAWGRPVLKFGRSHTHPRSPDHLRGTSPVPKTDLIEISWTTTERHTALIPAGLLIDAGRDNDDNEYLTDSGALDEQAFTGSVTGEFDALLAGYEHNRTRRVTQDRQWDGLG
jgi:hypothetical protein